MPYGRPEDRRRRSRSCRQTGEGRNSDLGRASGRLPQQAGERRRLSERTGLPERQLQRFVNRADLMRIRGVGGDFAELLVASGVRTVRDLSRRRSLNLALKMSAVNAEKKLSRRAPSPSMVERWIASAQELKEAAG